MVEIVKSDNQVRVYLDDGKKRMDRVIDVVFRNNLWCVSVWADDEVGRVFPDTQTMREFFEAGLKIVENAEGG